VCDVREDGPIFGECGASAACTATLCIRDPYYVPPDAGMLAADAGP
jgi:hypothetical protein